MPRADPLSLQAWDGVNQCEGLLRVVAVGPSELNGQWNPATVADQMALAAQLGPVGGIRSRLQPPNLPGSNCRPRPPVTNQSARGARASPAKRSGSVARCLPPASRADAANRSCQSRNPTLLAASAKESRFAVRTECPSDRLGPIDVVCHLWVCTVELEEAVRSDPTRQREEEH